MTITVPIGEIKPNPNNPRKIGKKEVERLKKSIVEFPDMLKVRPLVVDENMMVMGGNQRLMACIELGMEEVPVMVVENWDEEKKKEFVVKDNLSSGEWDFEVLRRDFDIEILNDWGLEIEAPILPEYEFENYETFEVEPEEKAEAKKEEVEENLFPISFVLGRKDYNKWVKFKKDNEIKTDLQAILKLLEQV